MAGHCCGVPMSGPAGRTRKMTRKVRTCRKGSRRWAPQSASVPLAIPYLASPPLPAPVNNRRGPAPGASLFEALPVNYAGGCGRHSAGIASLLMRDDGSSADSLPKRYD